MIFSSYIYVSLRLFIFYLGIFKYSLYFLKRVGIWAAKRRRLLYPSCMLLKSYLFYFFYKLVFFATYRSCFTNSKRGKVFFYEGGVHMSPSLLRAKQNAPDTRYSYGAFCFARKGVNASFKREDFNKQIFRMACLCFAQNCNPLLCVAKRRTLLTPSFFLLSNVFFV